LNLRLTKDCTFKDLSGLSVPYTYRAPEEHLSHIKANYVVVEFASRFSPRHRLMAQCIILDVTSNATRRRVRAFGRTDRLN
jgi:hypothetical protein